jgi:hypothetical protein
MVACQANANDKIVTTTATVALKLFICVQIFSDIPVSNKNASFFLFYPAQ